MKVEAPLHIWNQLLITEENSKKTDSGVPLLLQR